MCVCVFDRYSEPVERAVAMFGRADGDADLRRRRAAGFLPAAGRSRAGLQQEPRQTLQESSGTPQGTEAKVRNQSPS